MKKAKKFHQRSNKKETTPREQMPPSLMKLIYKEKHSLLSREESVKIQKLSSHFHSLEKGCVIIPKRTKDVQGNYFNASYCVTHKKNICDCGWEWHYHGGIYHAPSKYKNIKKLNKK